MAVILSNQICAHNAASCPGTASFPSLTAQNQSFENARLSRADREHQRPNLAFLAQTQYAAGRKSKAHIDLRDPIKPQTVLHLLYIVYILKVGKFSETSKSQNLKISPSSEISKCHPSQNLRIPSTSKSQTHFKI